MSRLDWLLGVSVFVVLLIVAVIGLFFWQQSQLDLAVTPVAGAGGVVAATRAPFEPSEGQPALLSFGRAHSKALAWDGEASLITASATWPQVNSADDVRGGQASWNFVFYSPVNDTAVSTTVVDKQVSVGDPYPTYQTLNPLQISGWQIDSDDAINLFLVNGGEAFLRDQIDVSLTSQLSTITGNGRMEWLISAFANRNGETFTIRIDASTGDILEVR